MIKQFITKEVVENLIHKGILAVAAVMVARKYGSSDQWDTISTWISSPATYAALAALASIARGVYNAMRHSKAITAVQNQAQLMPPSASAGFLKAAGVKASLVLLLLAPLAGMGQTNAALPLPANSSVTVSNAATIGQDVLAFFKDEAPFLATNTSALVQGGGLANGKSIGGELNLGFPLTQQLIIGGGFTYLHNATKGNPYGDWSVNLINAQVGKTVTIQGQSFYLFAQSGPNISFKDPGNVGAASYTGVYYGLKLGKNFTLVFDGKVGNITSYAGAVYGGDIMAGFKF